MGEITYTHETCWTDGLCFVIWKGGSRIARCDSKETAESICKTSNCHDELMDACEDMASVLNSLHFGTQIHSVKLAKAKVAESKGKAALDKVRGEK